MITMTQTESKLKQHIAFLRALIPQVTTTTQIFAVRQNIAFYQKNLDKLRRCGNDKSNN